MEKTERNYTFDNLKGILIFLVVFGHLIEKFSKTNIGSGAHIIFNSIYLIHMPLFIFISGYFSKKQNVKKVIELVVVYIFCQMVFHPIVISIVERTSYLDSLSSVLSPKYTYWYLLALVLWRMFTPYIVKIKYFIPISFICGIFLGFALGKVNLNFMAIGRVISFYPFFLLGYVTEGQFIEKLKSKISIKTSIIAIILILIFNFFFLSYVSKFAIKPINIFDFMYGRERYYKYLTNPYLGAIFKITQYIIQVFFVYISLCVFKNKKTFLCKFGSSSLLIYITHGVLVRFYEIRLFKLYSVQHRNVWIFLSIAFVLTLLYCFILSFGPIKEMGLSILSLPSKYLCKKEED